MSMYPIASQTLASPTGSIYFTGIPQTFTHLQFRIFGKNVGTSGAFDYTWMQFNGDGGSNYAYHRLFGDGSSAQSGNGTSSTALYWSEFPTTTGYTNMFGSAILDILDYTNTNKYKTIKNIYGMDQNGVGRTGMYSGLWQSTAAITSVQFNANSYNYAVGSTFQLYGITTA